MNLYIHLKWHFRNAFKLFFFCFCFFYHKQRIALFCLQDKGVAQSILLVKNFGFHNEYDDESRKCLPYSRL